MPMQSFPGMRGNSNDAVSRQKVQNNQKQITISQQPNSQLASPPQQDKEFQTLQPRLFTPSQNNRQMYNFNRNQRDVQTPLIQEDNVMIGSHFQNYMSNFNNPNSKMTSSQPGVSATDQQPANRKKFQLAEQLAKVYKPKQKPSTNQDQQFFNRRNNKNKPNISIDGPLLSKNSKDKQIMMHLSSLPQNLQQDYVQAQMEQHHQQINKASQASSQNVLERNRGFYQDKLQNQTTTLATRIKQKLNQQLLKRYKDVDIQNKAQSLSPPSQNTSNQLIPLAMIDNESKVTLTAAELVKLLGQAQNGQMQSFLGKKEDLDQTNRDVTSQESINVGSNDLFNVGEQVQQQTQSAKDPFSMYSSKNLYAKQRTFRVGMNKRLNNNRVLNRRRQQQYHMTIQQEQQIGENALNVDFETNCQDKQRFNFQSLDNEKKVQSLLNSIQDSTRSGFKSVNFSSLDKTVKDPNQRNTDNLLPNNGFQKIAQQLKKSRYQNSNGQSMIQDQIVEITQNEQSNSDSAQKNRPSEPMQDSNENIEQAEMIKEIEITNVEKVQDQIIDKQQKSRGPSQQDNSKSRQGSHDKAGQLKNISQQIRNTLLKNQLVDDLDESEILSTIANLVQKKKKANQQAMRRPHGQQTPHESVKKSRKENSFESRNQVVGTSVNNSDMITQFDKYGHSQKSKLIDQRQMAQNSHISKGDGISKYTNLVMDGQKNEDDEIDGTESNTNIDRMKIAQFTSRNDEQEINRQTPFDQEQVRQLQEKIEGDVQDGAQNMYMKSNTQDMKKNRNLSSDTKKDGDTQMNLYDKSVKCGKSIKFRQQEEPIDQRDSTSYLLEAVANQEESVQKMSDLSSGLGSYAIIGGGPPKVIIDKTDSKKKKKAYDKRKSLYVGRKSNSQNQIRNEELKDEITTIFPNEQIFNIDPNVFNDYSPEDGQQNKKVTKISFESDLTRFLQSQIDWQVGGQKSADFTSGDKSYKTNTLHFHDSKPNLFTQDFKENLSIYDNFCFYQDGMPKMTKQKITCFNEANNKVDNIIKLRKQEMSNEVHQQKQQQQNMRTEIDAQFNKFQILPTRVDQEQKEKKQERTQSSIERLIDANPLFNNMQSKNSENAIFIQTKREQKQIQQQRQKIISSIKDKIAMDLNVSNEIDQQLLSHQNLEEMSKFFLNTKLGYHVRKIPQAELNQVDLQEDVVSKPFFKMPSTPTKNLNSARKQPGNINSKLNQMNLTSIIEQREKRSSIEVKHEDSDVQSHQHQSQIQKILDESSFEQYNKVIQVLQLRKSCLSVNKYLHLLRANDKLLKKKVQFYEYSFTFPSTHSSLHQSDAQEPTMMINDRSNRSQSTKMQKSIAPSFQDSHFKQIPRLGDHNDAGTLQKKANKRQLYKHGTVEIMYDPKNNVNTNQLDVLKTSQKDNEFSEQLPEKNQRSNGQMTHKPGGSDFQKDSEGYLHPGTNVGNSTIDKVNTVQTPYFKLHTPAKHNSKSNLTFNSQSKLNQSQISMSNCQENLLVQSPASDKLSNDSSDQSALMNAKNIGLDGELLNNRRTSRSQSLVQVLQQRKMKSMSLNKLLIKGNFFSKLRNRIVPNKRQENGSMDKLIDDISAHTLIIIAKDELNQRETEMLLVHRLSIYFTKNNAQMQETIQKGLLLFNRMLTRKNPQIKRDVNPSTQILYQDQRYPQQEKELKKILKKMRKKCHFFYNQSLQVRDFKELNIVELSNQVDACEIEMKVTMESYIKDFGEKNKTKKLRCVPPKKISELNMYFDKLLKQIQDERLQIDLFPLSNKNQKIFVPLRMRTKNRKSLFKLKYLESKTTFCQLDYNTWLNDRLRTVKQKQKIQADYLFKCQLEIFMDTNGYLLRQFLSLDRQKPKLKLDSDYDDSSLLSDQVLSIYSSSVQSIDNKSVNSSYDNLSFNNIHNINVVHNDFNPLSIIGKVIIRKNANWEIFKLLSQSKNDKIKNKIKVNANEKTNMRENLIELRIKTIRKNAIEAIEFGRSHQNMFQVNSEESSDLESHLSMKQTSTYMYVEKIQEFLHVQMDPAYNSRPKRVMLTKQLPIHTASSKQFQEDQKKQANFFNNIDVDKTYGFRYNQLASDEWSPQREGEEIYDKTPDGRGARGKHRKKIKGNGMIKLLNGMPLSLDDEPVNLHCDLLQGRSKERALEHQKHVQEYYKQIRSKLRDMQYNENKIIKYRRSYCMNEVELDADHGQLLRELQEIKLKKYTMIRDKQSAFSTDVTKFFDKKYAIPFRDYYIREFNQKQIDPNEIARFMKAREKHMKNPWIGYKGQQFVLNYKLQSHGSFRKLKELREEVRMNESLDDIDLYEKSIDDDGYPIYLLFEVIHVYRIQERDQRENENIIACKLAMALKRKREMEAEMEERALAADQTFKVD